MKIIYLLNALHDQVRKQSKVRQHKAEASELMYVHQGRRPNVLCNSILFLNIHIHFN